MSPYGSVTIRGYTGRCARCGAWFACDHRADESPPRLCAVCGALPAPDSHVWIDATDPATHCARCGVAWRVARASWYRDGTAGVGDGQRCDVSPVQMAPAADAGGESGGNGLAR